MIQKIKDQNMSRKAFTLVELVIVLVIIGIMLMASVYLSGEQIQKVKDKTVKESILAEMQSRYSRNLWSSSYAWKIYDTMEVSINKGENHIDFRYLSGENVTRTGIFVDKFEIKSILPNLDGEVPNSTDDDSIILKYSPYNISCMIWESEYKNVVIIARVNDKRDYCLKISQKNCRMVEISEEKCKVLGNLIPPSN